MKLDSSCFSDFTKNFKDYVIAAEFPAGEKEYYISDSIYDVTGYTKEEITAKAGKLHSIVIEEDRPELNKKLAALDTDITKNKFKMAFRILTKEGIIKWIEETINIVRDESGIITEKYIISADVTEHKNNENDLSAKNDALRMINDSKDKFISIVSHDLRAPFTSLLGFTEILLNEPDLPEEDKTEYLTYIHDASKNQLQLINYLLDWSRLQTGRLTVEPKRQNLNDIISKCIADLTGFSIRKNIKVLADFSDIHFVQADERLISQAVTNLISNAIKFTPHGEKVTVSTAHFKEGMIEVVVKDNGIGIPDEKKDKLFKIEEKFSSTGTNGEKGSGLGLTLVKEIIEKHGGEIWFYSQLNQGSEFHITIPEAKNIVLVVEDDLTIRSIFERIIKKTLRNFEIITANNGYEAMSYILKETPSLVITDHEMPLMNGIQLVEALKNREKKANVPVIVVSARFTDEIKKKYDELGVDKMINKPFEPNILAKIITESVN